VLICREGVDCPGHRDRPFGRAQVPNIVFNYYISKGSFGRASLLDSLANRTDSLIE
jgi:hypothetical protein